MKLFQWYYRHASSTGKKYYFYPFKGKDATHVYSIIFGDRTWIEWFTISQVDTSFTDTNKSYQRLYRTAIKKATIDTL